MKTHKVLGLDLGVASIGWAMVQEFDDAETEIIGMGTRVVPYNLNNQTELGDFAKGKAYTTNQNRRIKRGMRRNFHRYLLRRNQLIALLHEQGMYPDEALRIHIKTLDLWSLRANAASKTIPLTELGRVLLHLNQKRGYRPSRKGNAKESSDYLRKIRELDNLLLEKKQTIGQFFVENLAKDPQFAVKKKIFSRASYQAEFDQIWQIQSATYPHILTDDFRKKIEDETIFYQRELKSQKDKVAECRFEKYHKVAPISSPYFQLYRCWQKVQDLRIEDKKGDSYAITASEKQLIFKTLQQADKLSDSQILTLLGLKPRAYTLNFKSIKGNISSFKLTEILGADSPFLTFDPADDPDQQPLHRLWHLLYSVDKPEIVEQKLQRYPYSFSAEIAQNLAEIQFEEGFGSLSTRAIRKLLPEFEKGFDYTQASLNVGYRHSDYETKEEQLSRQLIDKLAILPKDSLRNPIVEKIVNQVINLVNELIADPALGRPDEIRIELARSLRANAEEREKMTKGMQDREKDNKEIREELAKKYKRRISSKVLEKYRLLKETGFVSPYEPTKGLVEEEVLFGGTYDVEHILPKAIFFDNSFANKTICKRSINERKGDRTAYDFMQAEGDQTFHDYTELVHRLYAEKKISKTKRDRLLTPASQIPEGFLNRQLQETRYITKVVKGLLNQICQQVTTTTGAVTDYLRHQWGLDEVLKTLNLEKYKAQNKVTEYQDEGGRTRYEIEDWSKRDDHRNHAVDALVVACTKQGYIQQLNELSKLYPSYKDLKEDDKASLRKFAPPSKHFVRQATEATANILVSHKAGKKVGTWKTDKKTQQTTLVPRGSLHEETIYGKRGDRYTMRYELDVKFDKADKIVDEGIKRLVKARLAAYDNDPKKAFKELETKPIYLNEAEGIVIRRVKCHAHLNGAEHWNNNPAKPEGYVKLGNNHHVAIYRNDKGKLVEEVVTFWEAVERKKQGIPIINTQPTDGRTFVVSMQINELFVFGLSHDELQTAITHRNNKLISRHLYRTQKLTSGDYWFRLHNETQIKETATAKGLKLYIRVNSSANMTGIKVKLNRVGQVERILS